MAARKPLALFALLTALLAPALGCLPQPDDPVEYLRREDAIIVQLRTVDHEAAELERRAAPPAITLYGDGTLLYSDGPSLAQAELSRDEITELLDAIVDEGFLDFAYEQSNVGEGGATTYLYVHTLDAANSISIAAEDVERPADEEPGQRGDVRGIIERLREIAGSADGEPYEPEALVLVHEGADGITEEVVRDEAALASARDLIEKGGACFVTQDGAGCYRPLLPFEEHFPEFETP